MGIRHPERSEAEPKGPVAEHGGTRAQDLAATKVKLCGMFREEDLRAVAKARPDYVGFIVNFPRSHRSMNYVSLQKLLAAVPLPVSIQKVGVFVNEPEISLANTVRDCKLDLVQLHGSESEDYIARLRGLCEVPIIKAFKVRTPEDMEAARASSADYVLLDNGQGTGERFDWSLIEGMDRPYFLAGGLTPENVTAAIEALHPYAVDMSSSLETNRTKDPAKIDAAVKAVRKANA